MENTLENTWCLLAGDVGDIRIERKSYVTYGSNLQALTIGGLGASYGDQRAPSSSPKFCTFPTVKFVKELCSSGLDAALSAVGYTALAAAVSYLRYVEGLLEDLDYLSPLDEAALAKIKAALDSVDDCQDTVIW